MYNVLGSVIKDKSTGLTITDFDGVVVLTNDKNYADFLSGNGGDDKPAPGSKSYIVIVEAKEHLTLQKVQKKKEQRLVIQDVLKKLPYFKGVDPFIGLYIGDIDIDEAAKKEIEAFVSENKNNELIGTIELNGYRFSVNSDHGKNTMIFGGKTRRK